MNAKQLIESFDVDIPLERAWTPPSGWYTDDAIWQLERQTVFRDCWQPVTRLEDLAEPGTYASGSMAGEPWVVTRTSEGELRAFYNTCRHKGREVVTGCGKAEQLVCGYHAWRYDLDGRLRKAPRMANVEGFDRAEMSLVPLRAEAWGPWAWITRGADRGIRERVSALADELDQGEWAKLRFAARRSWTVECNWKVVVDNYLDGGYHIPHMHPTLDAQIDMSRYRTETFERYSIQTCPPLSGSDDRLGYDASERIGGRALYAWIYPNFMLNRYGPCLDTNLVLPLGPDRCQVEYEFYFEQTEGEEAQRFIEQSIAQSDVTQREDTAICESVQRGLHSESYDRGRYAPTVETGEHHFHKLLAADYRRGG